MRDWWGRVKVEQLQWIFLNVKKTYNRNLWKMIQRNSLLYLHVYHFFVDRIMMLSVIKHTESKVKFWFLKNYLSPSFKVCNTNAQIMGSFYSTCTCILQYILHKQMSSFQDFIPKMAKEYGFEYELVQYKWPRWLNQQKEKQRVMWGYVHVKSEKSVFSVEATVLLFIQHRIHLVLLIL